MPPETRQGVPRRSQAKGTSKFSARPPERLSGRDRAELYAFLAGTGLRVNEVRQSEVADLELTTAVAVVRLAAGITKSGKQESVPLRTDRVDLLRQRIGKRKPADQAFCIPSALIARIHADCRRAGIAHRDDRGLVVDVHSLRTTFGTWLSKSVVPPRVALQLMRHSDIRLTMQTYTDPNLFDLQGAVKAIPSVAHDPVKSSATRSFPVICSRDIDVA
jgi:integrase